MPSWARVGAQVVCIDDDWGPALDELGIVRVPMRNEVLTVTAVEHPTGGMVVLDGTTLRWQGLLSFLFAEIPEDQGLCGGICWPIGHFRPLTTISLEDDVARFRALADGAAAGFFESLPSPCGEERQPVEGVSSLPSPSASASPPRPVEGPIPTAARALSIPALGRMATSLACAGHRIPAGAFASPTGGAAAPEPAGSLAAETGTPSGRAPPGARGRHIPPVPAASCFSALSLRSGFASATGRGARVFCPARSAAPFRLRDRGGDPGPDCAASGDDFIPGSVRLPSPSGAERQPVGYVALRSGGMARGRGGRDGIRAGVLP